MSPIYLSYVGQADGAHGCHKMVNQPFSAYPGVFYPLEEATQNSTRRRLTGGRARVIGEQERHGLNYGLAQRFCDIRDRYCSGQYRLRL